MADAALNYSLRCYHVDQADFRGKGKGNAAPVEQAGNISGPKPRLTISSLASLYEPDSLKLLSKQVSDLLPTVDLTELLLEINAHTGFADEFFHASEASARADDPSVSISAVLMAEACNIGLEPLIRSNVPALTRDTG